jgi:transcriptional regulator with XRE-family HTH domain
MSTKLPFKNLGKTIRELRHEKGWSQANAASQLDISIPAFSKIETGATDINLSRLEQIAHLFGMSAVQLIGRGENGEIPAASHHLEETKLRLSEREAELIALQAKMIGLFEELHSKKKA